MARHLLLTSILGILLISGCGSRDQGEAERMATEHEGDRPTATEATRAPALEVETDTVTYDETPDGRPVAGYMAAPRRADSVLRARGRDPETARLPGIVVIHEWWGLNDNVRAATRRLAGEGYRALAVDVYRGAVAQTPDSARALMERAVAQSDWVLSNLQAAYAYLDDQSGAEQIAVLGWCFGGSRTFETVAASPRQYDAAVAYYGSPGAMTEAVLGDLTTPVLAHFGRNDQAIGMDAVQSFQSRLSSTEAPVQIHLYDAGHAFANPSGDSYDADAAQRSWKRTTAFLKKHLYATDADTE